MSLKHPQSNRLLLIVTIFLTFLAVAAPHAAWADTCDIPGGGGNGPNPGGGDGGTGDFYNSYATALHYQAGQKAGLRQDMSRNSPTLDIKLHYCYDLINDAIQAMNLFTQPGGKAALMVGILGFIVSVIINSVCQALVTDIQIVTKFVFSLFNFICLPMPQLHLGTLHLNTHTCTGMPLIQVAPMSASNGGNTPSAWKAWSNGNGATPKTYVPPGQ